MPSPSPSQRRSSRDRNRGSSLGARLFDKLNRRALVGGIWIAAALLCALAIVLDPIESIGQWTQSRSEPDMARGLAAVLILAVATMGGLLVKRLRGQGQPDVEIDGELPGQNLKTRLATVGIVALALGATLTIGDWLASHRHLPASELVLPINSQQESFQVRQGARTIEVMLPLRMTLRDVRFGGQPSASVEFARPGQENPMPRQFAPGQSLDVEGYRFAFVGFAPGEQKSRVFLSSDEENTIVASGVAGDSIRLSVDGPQFQIVEAMDNFLDVLGPAVQLEDEQGMKFWVFSRAATMDDPPRMEHSLRLESVEAVPAVVMTVTQVRAAWPFAFGLGLFLIGWLLVFAFPERIYRRRKVEGGVEKIGMWSLNHVNWRGPGALGISGLESWIKVAALPAGVVAAMGIGLVAIEGHPLATGVEANAEVLLWAAQIISWIAMATALVGAGVLAERSFKGVDTGGAVTMALAVWAAMGAVALFVFRRGQGLGMDSGLPLVSDAGPAMWTIPGISALSDLQIPVIIPAEGVAFLAGCAIVGAAVALAGAIHGSQKAIVLGWGGAMVAAFVGAFRLIGAGAQTVGLPSLEAQRELAGQWLRTQNLPAGLTERGEVVVSGPLRVDTLSLLPEISAFIIVGVMACAMLIAALLKSEEADKTGDELAGRDLFVRAILFAMLGWTLGLVLTWEKVGAPGVLAPMEWLGLSVLFLGLGVLTVGWRRGPSLPERILGAFGPAIIMAYLIIIVAIGATAGLMPGASVPLW